MLFFVALPFVSFVSFVSFVFFVFFVVQSFDLILSGTRTHGASP
jgi:hypothetical protein